MNYLCSNTTVDRRSAAQANCTKVKRTIGIQRERRVSERFLPLGSNQNKQHFRRLHIEHVAGVAEWKTEISLVNSWQIMHIDADSSALPNRRVDLRFLN